MIVSCWRPYPRPRDVTRRPAGMERGSFFLPFAKVRGLVTSTSRNGRSRRPGTDIFRPFQAPGQLWMREIVAGFSRRSAWPASRRGQKSPSNHRSSFPRPRESLSRPLFDRRPGRCFALRIAPSAYPACVTRRAGVLPASPVHRPSKVGDLLIYPDRCPPARLLSRAPPAGATQARRCVVVQAHNRARVAANRLSPRCRVRVASLSHTGRKAGASGPKSATTL